MVGIKRKIVWNEKSKQFFKEAIMYIRKSFPQNADKVKSGILKVVRELSDSAERHSPDKFKENNHDFKFRASSDEIRIVRIRHVKQLPEIY
jgi:plasmid stabilization system protein ParE